MSHFSSPDKMNYMQQQKMNQQTPNLVAMDRNDPSLLNCESPAGIPHSNGGSPPSSFYQNITGMNQKQAHMSDNVGMRRIAGEQAHQAESLDQRLVPSMMNSMQTPPQYAESRQQQFMKEFQNQQYLKAIWQQQDHKGNQQATPLSQTSDPFSSGSASNMSLPAYQPQYDQQMQHAQGMPGAEHVMFHNQTQSQNATMTPYPSPAVDAEGRQMQMPPGQDAAFMHHQQYMLQRNFPQDAMQRVQQQVNHESMQVNRPMGQHQMQATNPKSYGELAAENRLLQQQLMAMRDWQHDSKQQPTNLGAAQHAPGSSYAQEQSSKARTFSDDNICSDPGQGLADASPFFAGSSKQKSAYINDIDFGDIDVQNLTDDIKAVQGTGHAGQPRGRAASGALDVRQKAPLVNNLFARGSENGMSRKFEKQSVTYGFKDQAERMSHKADRRNHGMDSEHASMKSPQGVDEKEPRSGGVSQKSFEEFLHQIQSDLKQAAKDPDRQFEILKGNIVKLASKKVGSILLQDIVEGASKEFIEKIIDQLDGKLADLMVSKYGNYFCSKLIQNLTVQRRVHFLKQISGRKFVEISCDEKGTWVLQNILAAATEEIEFQIIRRTLFQEENILKLSKDNKGHHMIILIISQEKYPRTIRRELFDYILKHFRNLVRDKNGLCVMKEVIQFSLDNMQNQLAILNEISKDVLAYAEHEFANYVLLHVFKFYPYKLCMPIYDNLLGSFTRLSMDKYSSNLIEYAIEKADDQLQGKIVQEFISDSNLYKVVQGQFGNYVLQKSIERYVRDRSLRLSMIEAVINCLHEVTDWKVQDKWGHQLLRKYLQADGEGAKSDIADNDELDTRRAAALRSLEEKMTRLEESSKGSSGHHQRRRQPAGKQGNARAQGSHGRWGQNDGNQRQDANRRADYDNGYYEMWQQHQWYENTSEQGFGGGRASGYQRGGHGGRRAGEGQGFGRGMRQRPGHRPDSAGVASSQAYFGRPPYKNHDVYANSGVGGMSSGSGASTSQAASYDGFGEDGAAGDGEAYFGSQCHGSGSASGSAALGTSTISKQHEGSRKSSGQYSNQKRGSQAGGSSSGGNSKFTPKRGYNEEIKDEDLMVEPVDLNDVNPATNFVTNNRRHEELGGGKRGSGKGKVRTVKKRDVKFANQGDAAPAGRGGHRGGRGGYNKSQQADDTKHNEKDKDFQEEGGSELLSSESPSGPAEAPEKLRSQGDLEQVANEGGSYGSIFNQDPMLLYNCPPTH